MSHVGKHEEQIAALEQQLAVLRLRQERSSAALQMLHNISLASRGRISFRAIFEATYRELRQVFPLDACYLAVCDAGQPTRFRAVLTVDEDAIDYHEDTPYGVLTGYLLRQRTTLLFHNLVEEGPRYGLSPERFGDLTRPSRSWLGVPMLVGQDTVGVISIQSYQVGRYDEADRDLLQWLGNLVGIAIENIRLAQQQVALSDELALSAERERQLQANARLFAEAQASAAAAERQAHRMQLVHRISLLLSSHLDQQQILELASRELVSLFWADHTGTVLFDQEQNQGVVVAEYPSAGVLGQRFALEGNLLCDELVRTQQPVYLGAALDDPRAAVSLETFRRIGIASIVVVPLIARGRVLGSISLDSIGKPRMFTDEEQELFMSVAAVIASAIENARLFAAEQAARRTADTLREVARVLSSSFDPEEVLQLILGELERVVPYDSASIMLLDNQILHIAALRGRIDFPRPGQIVFRIDQNSGAALAVQRREPIMIADTRESSFWRSDVGTYVRSWLGVPLIARGKVIGLLNINACEPNRFAVADVETARAFANQAAVALENARLYQESVTRVEQELQIARQIQSNLFPRALPQLPGLDMAAECRPARETGGDFYDVVTLSAERLAIMVGDASGKSIPGAMLMAVARSIARSEARDHETPQEVMWETNRWIAGDVTPGSFVAFCYATLDVPRRRLALSNAGQLSPLHRCADGSITYLETPGSRLPLGILPDKPYAAIELDLQPGDTLVFYTDGIVEAHNAEGELFGFERLEALISAQGHLTPEELISLIMQAVDGFAGNRPQHDDMTLVVLRAS